MRNMGVILAAVCLVAVLALSFFLYHQHLQLAALVQENNELRNLIGKMHDELNTLRENVANQRAELINQRTELINLLSSYNDSITQTLSSHGSSISSLNQKTEQLKKEQNSLSDRIQTLEQEENRINTAIKNIQNENQQINTKITSIESRIRKIEQPEYTYIGTWQSKGDFITKETFTGKTRIRILYYFTGSSWDSWFSIWLARPDGTLISRLAADSGYYAFDIVEVYVTEDTYRLTVFVANGEVIMALFTWQ